MRAGQLRHRVEIQKPGIQADFGGHTQGWDRVMSVRAAIQPLNGKEYHVARGEASQITARIRLRDCAGLSGMTPEWRVVFGERCFDIQSVIRPGELRREIVLMCIERAD